MSEEACISIGGGRVKSLELGDRDGWVRVTTNDGRVFDCCDREAPALGTFVRYKATWINTNPLTD